MLSKSFKAGKCKTSLKLAAARLKLLKNKREVQLKQMKRDLAQLLESGQEQTARIRVEHVVREEKTMAAYEIIELYCELIATRLPIIESQKNCPIDLKEAITSVIFASPRCTDIPELLDVRKHFTKKYGKEFVNTALELRPDCGVNHMIVEKLSAKTPDGETKIKILTAIAREHNVKWDPAAMEEQVLKPHEDLLNGPSNFVSASKIYVESPNIQVKPPPGEKHEPATKFSENDVTGSTQTFTPFSANMYAPASMPTTSSPDLGASGGKPEGGQFRHSFLKDETSLNRRNWNMEFKDATSAAQAAAESAEMASMAARAAAELASHGKVTKEYSTESHASSFHGPIGDGPRRSAGWKFEGEHVEEDSVRREKESLRSAYGVKPRVQNKGRDEMGQDILFRSAESRYDDHGSTNKSSSRPASSNSAAACIDDGDYLKKIDGFSQKNLSGVEAINQNWQGKNYEKGDFVREGSFKQQSSRHASTNSSISSLDDEISVFDQKADEFSQHGFFEVESVNRNQQNTKIEMDDHRGVGSIQEQSSYSALSHTGKSRIDNDTIWDLNFQSYDNDADRSSINTGQGNSQRGTEKPSVSDYSSAVFDDLSSDCDTHLELESDNDRRHLDSYFPPQGTQSTSHLSSIIEPLSSKRWRSESLKDSSSVFVESSEAFEKATVPSQSDELLPVTFDDSDGLSSESEEDRDNLKIRERMESSGLPSNQNVSTSTSSHGPAISSFNKTVAEGSNRNAWSYASDDSYSDEVPPKSNQEAELNVVGESLKRHDPSDLLSNRPFPRHTRSPRKSSDLAEEPFFNSMVEDQRHVQSSRLPSAKEVSNKDKFDVLSSHPSTEDSGFSNNLSIENENELSFGRLRGGLRNKGLSRPPYIRAHSSDSSPSSIEQIAVETPTVSDKPTVVLSFDKTSVSSEACDNELYEQKHVKVQKDSSSNPKTFFDSDSDDTEEQSLQTVGRRGYRGGMLSRRTRDSPTQSVMGSPLRFNGRSEAPVKGFSKPSSSVDEPLSKRANETVISSNKENVKLTQSSSSIEQPYKFDGTPAVTEKSTISFSDKTSSYSEARENQKAHIKVRKESMSTPKTDSDSDSDIDDSEVVLPHRTVGSRANRGAMISRKTRDPSSQSEMGSPLRLSGRSKVPVSSDFGAGRRFAKPSSSVAETLSKPLTETVISKSGQNSNSLGPDSSIQRPSKFLPPVEISVLNESAQPSQPSSASEQPFKHLARSVISGRHESQNSSSLSGGSTSRENSLKTATHVHPKLPDYDVLAAHLGSLRSNRRPQ